MSRATPNEEDDHEPRINPWAAAPQLLNQMVDYSKAVEAAGLEKSLLELVKVRASQINGCAICLHMHADEARQHGETEDRILMLGAWDEAGLYTAREKAALAWTEVLTRLTDTHAPDQAYQAAKAEFSDEELVKLTVMITVINSWNRIGVGFRLAPVTLKKAA
ncbi:MAG: carboxymuconolactone decarboxylase family protein [Caulobacteraceae bacterium]